MSRSKSKYHAVVKPVIKENVLYTDKHGVSAVHFTKAQTTGFQYCIRYPQGYRFAEEDLPLSHTVSKDGASPEVLLSLVIQSLKDKPRGLLTDKIALLFIEMGTTLLKIRDRMEKEGASSSEIIAEVRKHLDEDTCFEDNLLEHLEAMERLFTGK